MPKVNTTITDINPLVMKKGYSLQIKKECQERLDLHKYSMTGVDVNDHKVSIWCDEENALLYTETFKNELDFIKIHIVGEMTFIRD